MPYFWTPEETEHLRNLKAEMPGRVAPVARKFRDKYPEKSYDAVKRKLYFVDPAPQTENKILPTPFKPFPWQYSKYAIKEEPAPKVKPFSVASQNPSTVLHISDLHAPFHHPKALDFLHDTYVKYKCNAVVCAGDELDFHAISRHPREYDSMGAKDELERGLVFMRELFKVFPDVQVCVSNHTSRPYRMGRTVGLLDEFFRSYSEWMQAPQGWSWHERIEIDGVLYFHGEPYSGEKGALNAMKDIGKSVAIGHTHTGAGVWQIPSMPGLFALNSGCLINSEAYAFRYAKMCRGRPVLGSGVVHEGKWAEFVPLKGA